MSNGNNESTPPRDGKGKGKGKEEGDSSNNDMEHRLPSSSSLVDNGSFASRLASSTIRRTQDLLSHKLQPDDLKDIVPSGKATSFGTTGESGTSCEQASTSNSANTPNSYPQDVFKSTPAQKDIYQGEEGFSNFLGGVAAQQHCSTEQMRKPKVGKARSGDASKEVSHVAAQSMTDGQDVIHLLESGYDEVAVQGDQYTYIDDDQRTALRRALFGEGSAEKNTEDQKQRKEALNFFPPFVTSSPQGSEYAELSTYLGVTDPKEAQRIWIDQWQDVLSSYTDEVWGDLSSLVGKARDELQILSSATQREATTPELNAVKRLEQILAHIR